MNRNVRCLRVCCVAFEYLLSTRNSSNVHNSVRREFYALAIYYLCACLSLLHPKILLNVGVFRLLSPSRCSTCSVFYDSPSTSSRVDVYVRYSTNNRNKNSPQSLHSQAKRHTIFRYGTVRWWCAHCVRLCVLCIPCTTSQLTAYLYLHHMPLTQSVRATITSIRPHTHSADTSTYLLRTRSSILLNVSMDTAYRTGHFAMSNRNLRSSSKLNQTTATTLGPKKLGRFNDRRQKNIRSYLYSGIVRCCVVKFPIGNARKCHFLFVFS